MKYNVMIDIETLGTKPGSMITAIGAVAFTRKRETDRAYVDHADVFYKTIDIVDAKKYGFEIDPGTVLWWLDQSKEAQQSLRGPTCIQTALQELTAFVKAFSSDTLLWANSPTFDAVLLEAAYTKLGLDAPWHYRNWRDCRTLFAEADFDYKTFCKNQSTHVAHNALADAITQAEAVIEADAKIAGARS